MGTMEMERRAAKVAVIKALAHPTRLWMVERLEAGELCVCELVAGAGADISTVSKHLSVLKQAGIIVDDKRGKQVFYRLLTPCVLHFITCVEEVVRSRVNRESAMLILP